MVDFADSSFRKTLEDLRASDGNQANGFQDRHSDRMHFHALRNQQSLSFREKIILAMNEDIKSKAAIRKRFSSFYILFLTVVTSLIFYVIIDPSSLLLGRSGFYSDTLKITLVGTFFATLFSAFFSMVKYGFTAEKQMIELFDLIGNENTGQR